MLATRAMPGPNGCVTEALTQPFHIVRTAKSELQLRFELSEETVSCE